MIGVNDNIIIQDWAGNDLFIEVYSNPQVNYIISINNPDDIYLFWVDDERTDNIYELI